MSDGIRDAASLSMIPPRHILVATDYSSASERALETAAALATRFRSELSVVHVIEDSAYAFPFPVLRGVREAAQAQLDNTVAGLRARLLRAAGVLREGVAWYEICACVTDLAADVVVIGSQGRRGLPRFVIGSVAERVVSRSPAPVMTIHPSDHIAILEGGMDRFRHILAPVDFSEATRNGVDLAVDLAREFEASLTLLHVHEWPAFASEIPDDVTEQARAGARRQLDERLAQVRTRLPNAEAIMREGVPWRVILDVANEIRADLMALSTHGRHGLQRILVGSVAEKIVRMAPIPLLTVAPGPHVQ